MRLRFAVLASLASALIMAVSPAGALAFRHHGPRHNHGLTINATPNPIIAGQSVLIYGQLNGPNSADQTIVLFHRVHPNHFFTVISRTTTDSHGFYEFTRPDGLVRTNRDWFTRAPALDARVHSRTVHERVAALLSLAASSPSADTNTPITFSGEVSPNHAGEAVFIQKQVADNGNGWKTIQRARLVAAPDGNSSYSVPIRFRVPGDYELRTVFRSDPRNIRAASDPTTVSIQQAQVPDFTINTSDPIIDYGSSATISGTLYLPGTTTPDPNVSVTLWGRTAHQPFRTIGLPAMTDANGSYSFTVDPTFNTIYVVRTTNRPPAHRSTATLFEGVRDVVSLTSSAPNPIVGQTISFSGTVSPDKAGHAVYLEELGVDGNWHVIEAGTIRNDSTYSLPWTAGQAGTFQFRTRVPGGPHDVSGVSAPVTETVTVPPVASLPPAS
jgi:hypothetical protein